MTRTLLALTLAALSANASAVLTCANDTYAEHAQWYVGQSRDVLGDVDLDGDVWCTATGAELAYIQRNFGGLRQRAGARSVTWLGDDAAFVLANL